jgi:Ca-activated chloride channel family protein
VGGPCNGEGLRNYLFARRDRVREQSDTGDESELSADDYVFDNTKDRGLEMEITDQSTIEMESAEKWMRGVDTETSDFLRTRFLLEATREGAR